MTTETATEDRKDYLAEPLPHEENVGVVEGSMLSVIDAAEISQQIATAHRFPRSFTSFRRRVYQMVTIDTETAESCIYAIPRDGKMIDGPSIRFAELLLVAWGNHRSAAEVTSIDDEFVVASGVFFDLETNGAIQAKVMRRITGKPSPQFPKGKRFSQDMIATTGNAACSIALRNAVLRGVPKALWKDLFDEAKKVAGGTAQTFGTRRDKVLKELAIQGATPEQIYDLLGIKGVDDMVTEHLVHLRGLQNAIKDGETTVDEAFGKARKPGEAVPQQPRESDFTRKDTGGEKAAAKDDKPPTDAKQEKPAAEPAEDPKPGASVAATGEQPANSANDAIEDYFKDVMAEIPKLDKVRKVADHREAAMENLEGYPEKLKELGAACDARTKEILNASRKPK
jgi:hypothetical protein